MKNPEKRNAILTNAPLWIVAQILHPILNSFHTGSGNPSKILSLLIPVLFLSPASVSTHLLGSALEGSEGE